MTIARSSMGKQLTGNKAMGITDKDKLGMAALIASTEDAPKKKSKVPLPRPRPAVAAKRKKITVDDVDSGRVSIGDANDEAMMGRRYNNGGMVRGDGASRVKTKGKNC